MCHCATYPAGSSTIANRVCDTQEAQFPYKRLHLQALSAMSSLAKLGVKAAFQNSGKTPWRRGDAAQDAPAVAARQEGEEAQAHTQAQALFRWLFSSCVVYELFCW